MQIKLDKPLYTVDEAIGLMRVGRTKFYQELAAGRIFLRKSGQRSLVPAEAIKKWIAALPVVSGSEAGGGR